MTKARGPLFVKWKSVPEFKTPVQPYPDVLEKESISVDCKTVCIFTYSCKREQSNKRSGTRLKTESETRERR